MKEPRFTAEQIAKLSPGKRELLDRLVRSGVRAVQSEVQPLQTRGDGLRPLSFAQERMWVIDQLQPNSAVYNIPRCWSLVGTLHPDALRDALNDIVDRHRTLTSSFAITPDGPVQSQIEAKFSLDELDISHLPMGERSAACNEALNVASKRPFDLSRPPLVRALLVHLGATEHVLLIVIHHIASDGWSQGIFVRELSFAYAARSRGRTPSWSPLTADYQNYVAWQRQWLSGEVLAGQLAYWHKQLEGLASLELPLDHARPAQPSYRGEVVALGIPADLTGALNALARRNKVTLHMVLLSALQTLLMRYSGQEDIAIGTPVAGRSRLEHEQLIGLFVNTLVLRGDLSGNPRFTELLGRTRGNTLDAYDHQHVPFEKLVSDLEAVRDMSRNPLFQVSFVLQNTPDSNLEMPGIRAVPEAVHTSTSKFDLALSLTEQEGMLVGTLEYSTDLFHASTIEQMTRHWLNILRQVVADPDCRLDELTLLSDEERHRLLVEWNNTAVDYPREKRIHELFEAQAGRTPDAIALVFNNRELSYRQLNERADKLARHLIDVGVLPETLVGMCIERSPDLLVGILGILKADAAYVPLDPKHPVQRLEYMLEDAAVRHLVIQRELQERVPFGSAELTYLDQLGDRQTDGSADAPAVPAGADGLAYVLYTSGSTGRPKGVQIPHSAVVNLLYSIAQKSGFAATDRFLNVTTPTFDISIVELLLPLMVGASVEIVPQDIAVDPAALSMYLETSGATVMQATPVTWQMLVNQGWVGDPDLTILCGGEVLSESLADALCRRSARLLNGYGPTETTIYSTMKWVEPRRSATTSIPIGRPLANTQVYVLDAKMQPVPIGVRGELYIGGDGLARGYLNQRELTAEKFVANPFSSQPESRLYRTGDSCRWRADGDLEFLGRLDDQVKLRGFRIEPGEIEAALLEHPEVGQSVVTMREDRPGDKRLVGYVVSVAGQSLSRSELRTHLRGRLPDYMIPTAFVELHSLPLTPGGKIDRRVLPPPDDKGSEFRTGLVPPGSAIERQLAQIWCEVLGLEQVGIHDDFFELGGHSLLATKVVARLKSFLNVNLSLRELFEAPTIVNLAARVEVLSGQTGESEGRQLVDEVARLSPEWRELLARLAEVGKMRLGPGENRSDKVSDGPKPLSPAQERMWLLDQLEPGGIAYNRPTVLHFSGALETSILQRALNEILRRHAILRTVYRLAELNPEQWVVDSASVELAFNDLRRLPRDFRKPEAERLIREEIRLPFDLRKGPLMRARLLQVSVDDHWLVLTTHHIVFDGWSQGVLQSELADLYAAFCDARPSPLPELEFQYGDYVDWQRASLQSPQAKRQLEWWRQELEGAMTVLELPADYPRPVTQSQNGARVRVQVSASLTAALRELASSEEASLFMVLMAAWNVLLYRYTAQEDIIVGFASAGRILTETEPLIGLFMNSLPLRTNLSGRPDFKQLLRRVREATLSAYARQNVPLQLIVDALPLERDASRTPLYQHMFVLQNTPRSPMNLGTLVVDAVEIDWCTSKLDLALDLHDGPEGLTGFVEYNTDLFAPVTIERMCERFLILIEGIVADSTQIIADLPLISAAERQQLLVDWNNRSPEKTPERCIHRLFEAQVARTPDAIAVVAGDRRVVYRELNSRSNQLAHRLRREGITPGALVGLFVERSLEMVVGALGILKAGGAYVPLDPQCPPERLAFMLDDASLAVLVTQEQWLPYLPPRAIRRVCFDCSEPLVLDANVENLDDFGTLQDAAYVIYTSGSTGKPKGVVIEHRALVIFSRSSAVELELTPDDRILQFAPLTFDAHVEEIFPGLVSGATIVLRTDGMIDSAVSFLGLCAAWDISVLSLPTAYWHQLTEVMEAQRLILPVRLRLVVFGGEEARADRVDAWFRQVGGSVRLLNSYGPTEATVVATTAELSASETNGRTLRRVSIGHPMRHVRAYVLDARMRLVPIGMPGELCIGGDALARGYLNQPELTTERFVADPFSDDQSARLYHTGDLCRWRVDGSLEFLGRADTQVKLRGFRIELGEIEAVLGEHPDIRQCVVTLREDTPHDQRLVGYVVSTSGQPLTLSALRAHLLSRLPDYMVPSSIVQLQSIPKTSSGKIDRRALIEPSQSGQLPGVDFTPPQTALEKQLASIWCSVLGLARVGTNENFHELGGHSLLAMKVIARIKSSLDIDLPLRQLFESPTIEGLVKQVERLRTDGSHLASALAQKDGKADGSLIVEPNFQIDGRGTQKALTGLNSLRDSTHPVDKRDDVLKPLSFAQERMWVVDHLQSGGGLYNIPQAWRLFGSIRTDALQAALNDVIDRHKMLRTGYSSTDDGPVQHEVVTSFPLDTQDLALFPPREQAVACERALKDAAQLPFDLSQPPLARALLVRLGAAEHVLLVVMHHIASDGWSLGIFLHDLSTAYAARSEGRTPAWLPLASDYQDYAVWQREQLTGEVLSRQLDYWRKQLEGLAPLELPLDHVRPARPSYRGDVVALDIRADLTAALKTLARQNKVTLHMVLLSAFQTLLMRYSNQEDIAIGTPVAGRSRREDEELIGFFVNTLVLRGDLSGNPRFTELLARTRGYTLDAYDHQHVPFEKLVSDLQTVRDTSRNPLFQVSFVLQNTLLTPLELSQLTSEPVLLQAESAKFDLSLSVIEGNDSLQATLVYSTELFRGPTIERMAGHLHHLLGEIVADPDCRIEQLPLMGDVQRRQVMSESNKPRLNEACQLPSLSFEEHARLTPDHLAVHFRAHTLTFKQLNEQANKLAHFLRAAGVGADTIVGLCMERSLELVVGMLAILKAGGAWMPLDSRYPQNRLELMLRDAGTTLILSHLMLKQRLSFDGIRTVSVDDDRELWSTSPTSNPPVLTTAENLAYVIFTSGSTGTPKGVMVTNRGVSNHMQWMNRCFHFLSTDIFLQKTSINFDASVWEFLAPLMVGGQLVLAEPEADLDPELLSNALLAHGITHLQVTPTMLRGLLSVPAFLKCLSLKMVFVGGEVLDRGMVQAFHACLSIPLCNLYGPTEATIDTHYWLCDADGAASVPIGHAISNTSSFVVDRHLDLVPIGVPGELCIGGEGLARGYLNHPELTAERFVPSPFETGERLYRSGDRVRWNDNGELEFLGRIDHQLKLRGYRIEPGEIEAAILEEAIHQCVVMIREDHPGDQRLVAYLIGRALDVDRLRSRLKLRLPEFMTPALFVDLDHLPMTRSGKVDRLALPKPDYSGLALHQGHVEPRNPVERQVAQIWCEVLGLENVGIHDNFFDLGGHSILAARVRARLKILLKVEIPLRTLFDAPTIAEMASFLPHLLQEVNPVGETQNRTLSVDLLTSDRCAPLSFAQARMWFLAQMHGGSAAYNMPAGLRLRGQLDVEALRWSIQEVIRRHEPLRTTIGMEGDQPIQFIRPAERFELRQDVLSKDGDAEPDQEIASWCQQQANVIFDLSSGFMIRASLLRVNADDHVLMMVLHHIACDGWSIAVLISEVSAFYEAFRSGNPNPLPDLRLRYTEYSRWQRNRLQGEFESGLINYWRERLKDAPRVLELPGDWARPGHGSERGEHRSLVLTSELTRAIEALGRQAGTTTFTTMLATFQFLLGRLSGQRDVVAGIPIAGRTRTEHEPLIGLFLNMLVIRTELVSNQSFNELLKQVHNTAQDAYEHQDLPFERLVEILHPERSTAQSPLVQVLFNGLSVDQPRWQSPELSIEQISSGGLPSKYDLTVYVQLATDQILVNLVYNPDLFSADRMIQFLEQYRLLLEQVVEAPDRSMDAFGLLTASAGRLLPDPRVKLATPAQVRVTDQVQGIARRLPEQVAVTCGCAEWCYAELWSAAQQFTDELHQQGVVAGASVAVYGRASFGLISSIVGLMHSGAVLVLIDPKQPTLRQQFMVDHAGCSILVVVGEVTPDAQVLAADRVLINVGRDRGEARLMRHGHLGQPEGESRVRYPEHAAYVFFTSGTTGTPKGVIGSHAGLSHFINWQRTQFAVGPDDRIAHVTGISFDVVMREIFLPLTSGARLCIPDGSIDDPSVLWPWLDRQRVTILHSVPSRLQTWLSLVPNDVSLRDFRLLFMAGEPLSHTLVKAWRRRFVGDIVNLYGPTETTLAKAWYRVASPATLYGGIQPIGGALPQTQLLVLGQGGQRCGVGELGEIVIRTPFRSLGYLDTGQTRERFKPNPFSSDPEDWLYHTGDLGRFRPDGVLEIAGRLDDQIKIGGVRVEPAEVAGVLSMQPDVGGCHVGVVPDAHNEQKLVAWVVPLEGGHLEPVVLQKFLSSRLPGAMIPTRFVMLETMPLTPNGKVDRRALPMPVDVRPEVGSSYVAPRSEVEHDLVRIWSDVLGLLSPGIHDDFFALGGHSLLATRVKARIASSMKVDVPLPRLFEAPTIAELASDIEVIRSRGPGNFSALPVRIHWQSNRPLLSFAQQRLWFLEQMERVATAYNLPYAWEITGHLNEGALVRALQEIVARHEPLRTTFILEDQEPVQLIAPDRRLSVEVMDLTGLSPALQDSVLATRRQQEIARPFDLACDLMLRASLLKLSQDRQVLLLTMHHVATDGTSLRLLWRELESLYSGFSSGNTPQLPELPVRYSDFAHWQRGQLQGARLGSLVYYWRTQLAGLEPLELPTDRPRPTRMSHRGARQDFELSAELVARLQRLSQETGVTLHMLLLTAFQILLSRYARQEDVAVGVPVAGRSHTELENLIGFFVNTVVIRADLSGSPSFKQMLGRVRRSSLAAYEHQEIPFEKLVEELRPERHLGRNPLVQVMFQLLNITERNMHLNGLSVLPLASNSERVAFDLELNLMPMGSGLAGVFKYSTELFDAGTIVRMAGHFRVLLEGIVADPDCHIGKLPLLGDAERHQVLFAWNDTAVDYPSDKTVHGLFEAQAARTPDANAVVSDDEQLTYRQLNERANRLAHHLIMLDVKPGSLVGLCLERSLDLVIGILGILKAGAAYVPLDPKHPVQRLDYMVQEGAIGVLVTASRFHERLADLASEVVCIDHIDGHPSKLIGVNPSVGSTSDQLAYVMFTSGSTGQPKGVSIPHRAIVRLVFGNTYASFGQDRVFLHLATPSFDASTLELWGALLHGGRLVVAPDDVPDVQTLGHLIQRHRVSTIWLTSSFFNLVIDQDASVLQTVQEVLTGGEALSVQHVRKAQAELGPGVQLINCYGPTESTTFATCYRIPYGHAVNRESILIGQPIGNTRAYVLDVHGAPVPVGVAGELHIGGDGLASGYLNQPELTAEKFRNDPFLDSVGARSLSDLSDRSDPSGGARAVFHDFEAHGGTMQREIGEKWTALPTGAVDQSQVRQAPRIYRTGDLVRWRLDGNLEFLGRLDDQVKLRGFRIEPAEIEVALREHPEVAQAVVSMREDRPGDRRLVAYLVLISGQRFSSSAFRTYLQGRLPGYMIPSAFVELSWLPLTSSGKIDRRALPLPEDQGGELTPTFVAPGSVIELQLAQIWCEVLNVERVGIHDNFFALGGHSLLATRVLSRLRSSLQIEVALRTLFEAPTIAELADQLEPSGPLLIPETPRGHFLSIVRPLSDRGNVICVGGHVIELLQGLPSDVGILYLGSGAMEPERFHRFGIAGAVKRYMAELAALDLRGRQVIVGFSYGGLVAYALCARMRQLIDTPVDAVLLEPSLRVPRQHPATALLMRMGRYAMKALRHGPAIISNSVRRRREERVLAREAVPLGDDMAEWNAIWPSLRRNIASYHPVKTESRGIHLVAGSVWLGRQLDRFRAQLVESPQVQEQGEVTHHGLVEDPRSIARWRRLIIRILSEV